MEVEVGKIKSFQDIDYCMLKVISFQTYRIVQWAVDRERASRHLYVTANGSGRYLDTRIKEKLWMLNSR